MTAVSSEQIAAAVLRACEAELLALKPGNVSVYSDSAGLTLSDFRRSAAAIAEPISVVDRRVGQRILAAIQATRAVVDTNTNLGIVLLLAPLAGALSQMAGADTTAATNGGAKASAQSATKVTSQSATKATAQAAARAAALSSWRRALSRQLMGLTVQDAVLAYQAIKLAQPGGLGKSAQQDVSQTPSVTLLRAMALASDHDAIAAEYVSDFRLVFEVGLPAFQAARARGWTQAWATTACFLKLQSRQPDTLLQRKFGRQLAVDASRRAGDFEAALVTMDRPELIEADLLAWDRDLKQAGQNPGTTADLVVACLFLVEMMTELGL